MSTTTNDITTKYTTTIGDDGVRVEWQGNSLEVTASQLEQGGWTKDGCDRTHCDDVLCAPYCEEEHLDGLDVDLREFMRRWHDDEGHAHAYRFCDLEPCKTTGAALGVRHG